MISNTSPTRRERSRLERYPLDQFRITCWRTKPDNMCACTPKGIETNALFMFAVGGELAGTLHGVAASEFFRGKSLRSVRYLSRVD